MTSSLTPMAYLSQYQFLKEKGVQNPNVHILAPSYTK